MQGGNQVFKRVSPSLAISLILATVFVVSSCGKREIAATVNGKPIYVKEIDRQIAAMKKKYGDIFEGKAGKELEEVWRKSILDVLIADEVKYQGAVSLKVKVSDEEVEEKVAQVKGFLKDEANYQRSLKEENVTEEELRRDIKARIMRERAEDYLAQGDPVTEEEVARHYRKNLNNYLAEPEKVQTRHILLSSESEAEEVLRQVQEGADFAKLAQRYSQDTTSKASGGDIGLKARDELAKEYAEAAFSLEPGEISPVVKTDEGFHLIKLVKKQPASYTPLEQAEESIRAELAKAKKHELVSRWFDGLWKKAKIERFVSQ